MSSGDGGRLDGIGRRSSSSWSRELGTLSTLMNNGDEVKGREEGKKQLWRRRRREWGSDVHLTGGGVPPLDLSCLAALTAVAHPSYPASIPLRLPLLSFLFPPLVSFFLPAPATCSIQNTWFDRKRRGGGPYYILALVNGPASGEEWLTFNISSSTSSSPVYGCATTTYKSYPL